MYFVAERAKRMKSSEVIVVLSSLVGWTRNRLGSLEAASIMRYFNGKNSMHQTSAEFAYLLHVVGRKQGAVSPKDDYFTSE